MVVATAEMSLASGPSPDSSPSGSPSTGRAGSLSRFSRKKQTAAPSRLTKAVTAAAPSISAADGLPHQRNDLDLSCGGGGGGDGTKLTIQAMELLAQRECKQAEVLFRQALALNETRLGVGHVLTVASVVDCSRILQFQGLQREASSLLRMELARAEAILGPNHPNIALLLSDLASVCVDLGQISQSVEFLRRELAIRDLDCRSNNLDLVRCLHTLAHTLSQRCENEEAEQLCQRALTLAETKLSPEHYETVSCLCRLAEIQMEMGRRQGPLRIFQRAFAILQRRRMEHPLTADILRGLRGSHRASNPDHCAMSVAMERVVESSTK